MEQILKTVKDNIDLITGFEIWDPKNKNYKIVKMDWPNYKIGYRSNERDTYTILYEEKYSELLLPLEKILKENEHFYKFNLIIRDVIEDGLCFSRDNDTIEFEDYKIIGYPITSKHFAVSSFTFIKKTPYSLEDLCRFQLDSQK